MKSSLLAVALLAALGGAPFVHVADAVPVRFAPGTVRGVDDYRFEPVVATDAVAQHSATLLDSGRILLAGGNGIDGKLASALLYEPVLRTWVPTGALSAPRSSHGAERLASGQVLVFGGIDDDATLATAELYDPSTGTWRPTGAMTTPRERFAHVRLADGRVLVAGGNNLQGGIGAVQGSVEIYDPSTATWTATAPLIEARMSHSATLLASGKVLVLGGYSSAGNAALASAEIYDPATGTWSAAAPMPGPRMQQTATRLPSGKVLVVGGSSAPFMGGMNTALLYDPVANAWQATPDLAYNRDGHSATLLPSGKVLVAGGGNAFDVAPTGSSELYDPVDGTWSEGPMLTTRRLAHEATALASGEVLLTGGLMPVSSTAYVGAGDLFTNLGSAIAALAPPRLAVSMAAGTSATQVLTLANEGGAATTLVYTVGESALGCSDPGEVPWLATDPAGGTIAGGASDTIDVAIDAHGLVPGSYSAWLCLATNDAQQPSLPVPVQVVVSAAADSIFRNGFEAVQPVQDPGFETPGVDPSAWHGTDSSPGGSGTELFRFDSRDAHGGNGYVLFGARFTGELTQAVAQDVVIPAGGARRLNYWRMVSFPPSGLGATLTIRVDDQVVDSVDLADSDWESEYGMHAVDVSAHADGGTHRLEFRYDYVPDPAGWPNDGMILLDDVTIDPAQP